MRKSLLFILAGVAFFCGGSAAYAETIIDPDTEIASDTTWSKDAGPYIISGDIQVSAGARLRIEPGTVVKFSDGASLFVFGSVEAGTAGGDPVVFTSIYDDPTQESQGMKGDWGEIDILSDIPSSFANAEIKFSNGGIYASSTAETRFDSVTFTENGDGVFQINGGAAFNNVKFIGTDNPIFAVLSQVSIASSQISDIGVGSGVVAYNGSNIVVNGLVIQNVANGNGVVLMKSNLQGSDMSIDSTSKEGIYAYTNSSVDLSRLSIKSALGNGAVTGFRGTHITLRDSDINDSISHYGIEIYDNSSANLAKVNISNAGIDDALALFTNSTADISESSFTDGAGDGLYIFGGSKLNLSSSTISNFAEPGVIAFSQGTVVSINGSRIENNGTGVLAYSSANVSVTGSKIQGNGTGILTYPNALTVHAQNNYWGDPTGPYHSVSNPSGKGDEVSDLVDFAPWLSADPFQTCCSSIMFLPGFEASRMYRWDASRGVEDRLWEPNTDSDVKDLYFDESGNSIKSDIYTKDVIDEPFEVGATGNIYKSFLQEMGKWKGDGMIADYSAVPYDWRLGMADILSSGNKVGDRIYYTGDLNATDTPYILQELRRLADSSKSGKVTIVAHSNGGLVAKALLKRLEETNDPLLQKVDNLILVAVPQMGTPQAIGALLHGYDQGIPVNWLPFLLYLTTAREFGRNIPGAYPLLPSAAYWQGDGYQVITPPVQFENGEFLPIQKAIAAFGDKITSGSSLFSFLKGDEGRSQALRSDLASPSVLNAQLLSYAADLHLKLDGWTPPQSMKVHEIAGWGEETVSAIVYRAKNSCLEYSDAKVCLRRGINWTYKPDLVVDGDGTVVVPSALAISTSSPNVKRWWVDLRKYDEQRHLQRRHKDILEIASLMKLIENISLGISSTTLSYISETQPPQRTEDNALIFFLHSPLDLEARDSQGNSVSSSTSSILGARYGRFGEVQYIFVPASTTPTIVLRGYESDLFDLDIEEARGGLTVASTTFSSVPATESTVVTMEFPRGDLASAGALEIDKDGNGIPDATLVPKVGEEVSWDFEPPHVLILSPLPGNYERSKTIIIAATSTDNIGVASTSLMFGKKSLKNGEKVDLFFEKLGTTTISAAASDLQGNTASTSLDIRIVATASSTVSDINRAYDLGWIKKKSVRNELIKRVESVVKFSKKVREIGSRLGDKKGDEFERKIDKIMVKALLAELKFYRKEKINEQAYNLIKEDLEWLINN